MDQTIRQDQAVAMRQPGAMVAQSSAVQLPPWTSTTAGPQSEFPPAAGRSAYSRRRPPTSMASNGSASPGWRGGEPERFGHRLVWAT